MPTVLEKPDGEPISGTIPEANAFMLYLMRNESMRALELKVQESEKITQNFLKYALETIIQANADLEYKLSMALLKIAEIERKGDIVKKSAEYFAQNIPSVTCNTSHP